MLQFIVFTCGAALMGLEFLAARMLAPTLGSSLFVWGSVISIVMVALSLGYWLGGQIADRLGATRTLGPIIALAGLFTVLVPGLSAATLPSLAGLGARTGSLVASTVVFFVPSLLLAMVSPLGVRLATGSVDRVGRSAGTLYAISTAGSIAGTLATAFWLIPLLSLDGLVVAIGFTLFATSGLAALLPRIHEPDARLEPRVARVLRGLPAVALTAVILGVVLGIATLVRGPAGPEIDRVNGERVIYQKDTQYHRLFVTEDSEERHLRFDRSHQTAMYLDDPFETSFAYPGYLHLPVAVKPDARRVLIVGLGGGSAVKRYWRDYPEMRVDTVEIDPTVVEVAYRHFALPRDERIRVVTEDGRRFLQSTEETYDIIILDAYYADALPFHLTTEEFFREVEAHLSPGGVIAYNVIGSVEGDGSRLFRSMHRTASLVWERLWVFPIGIGRDGSGVQRRNIIVLATDAKVSEDELRARIANRVSGRVTVAGFERFADDLYTEFVPVKDAPLLTDEHAPTDALIDVQ